MASELPGEDCGALIALLGSAERALYLAKRIEVERRSVSRELLPEPEPVLDHSLVSGSLLPKQA